MNNELTSFTFADVMNIGKSFYESGMFADIKSAAQAVVKITAGKEIGIPPFASMTGIHIIQGKPTIGAGLIASRVKGSGKYDYKVVEQTELVCSIDFYQGKEMIGNSKFTIEDAKKAGTQNITKFPRNMLFARAISNGVKWYCPDVFSGPIYVPEEMPFENKTEDATHTEVKDTGFDAEQAAYNIMLTSQSIEELGANWKLIGPTMQAAPRISDLKNRLKVELEKLPV